MERALLELPRAGPKGRGKEITSRVSRSDRDRKLRLAVV